MQGSVLAIAEAHRGLFGVLRGAEPGPGPHNTADAILVVRATGPESMQFLA